MDTFIKDFSQATIATIIVAGFFWVAQYVLRGGLDNSDPNTVALIGGVVGYASAKADQVVSYYFGSSRGSADKANTIAAMTTQTEKGKLP